MQFSKIFMFETTRPKAFIFGIKHHLEVLYQICSNYAIWVIFDPSPGVTIFALNYIRKTTSSLEPLLEI